MSLGIKIAADIDVVLPHYLYSYFLMSFSPRIIFPMQFSRCSGLSPHTLSYLFAACASRPLRPLYLNACALRTLFELACDFSSFYIEESGGLKWTRTTRQFAIGRLPFIGILPCSLVLRLASSATGGALAWTLTSVSSLPAIRLRPALLYAFCKSNGGLKWTRTTDLTLIRRAL